MLDDEEHALALADKFYSAALGADTWYSALEAFAAATGSRTGELITIGPNAIVPINLMTNTDPDLHVAFIEERGADPAVNPRVRAGMTAPLLTVLAENDFLTPHAHKTHPHYRDFARPWDIPYICLSTLDRRDGLLVGLAVCRSEREGHITNSQRDVFARLTPHVRSAVQLQMTLANHAANVLSGVFESLSLPVFICDRSGRVQLMTTPAEAFVTRGNALQMKAGRLLAAHDADCKALLEAIDLVANTKSLSSRVPKTVVIRSNHPSSPALLVDVMRMPAQTLEFHAKGQVLVIPQSAGGAEARRRILLQTVYKLTAAEIDVAMQLSQGRTAESIANDRNVAIATVRAQIKCVLAKFGLTRQIELVAKLAQL